MLRLFGHKVADHPFADLKKAREFLSGLIAAEPLTSLEDLTHWLQSVSGENAFKPEHRAQAYLMIDETAQPHLRRALRDYLAATRLPKQQELRIWNVVDAYLQEAAGALVEVAEWFATRNRLSDAQRAVLALLTVRALRTLAARLKWMHLRYGPVERELWPLVTRVYAASERARVSQQLVTVYSNVPGDSSMQHELLRLLMFSACSPGALLPVEMELADRLISHFAPMFAAAGAPSDETPYWVNLGAASPPRRGPVPAGMTGPLGFFGAGPAYEALRTLAAEIRNSGAIPSALNLGNVYETDVVLAVIDHLEAHWAPRLRERRFARQAAKLRLTVAHGFDGVLDVLQLPPGVAPVDEAAESWIVENISAGGCGALVPSLRQDWLHVGCLLGMHYEGGSHWSVGIVRRLSRPDAQRMNVGIQVLSRAAQPVELRIETAYGLSLDTEVGVLLPPTHHGDELRLLLRPGVYVPGQRFKVEVPVGGQMLEPVDVVERGEDYELLRCREPEIF